MTQGSVTTQFAYNGDGVRTSKTVGGDTTQYVMDLGATLPLVISDPDAIYLYGLDVIAQQQPERYYYVHDGLGSVRHPSTGLRAGLVDTTGQIETNYAYDPFGVPVMGGEVYNPYQYTGEAWDAEVELLYLRARYYQPEVGRFTTKDPWRGDTWEPGTLNRYAYVRNSPVNSSDATGLQDDGYSSYESYRQSRQLVSDWYREQGDVRLEFGPEEPLTWDVRYSPGVQQFKNLWRDQAKYTVPWAWTGHSIDERTGYPTVVRVVWGAARALHAHWKLGVCSRTPLPAESQNDPVYATLGSLDEISVHAMGTHKLAFEVFNTMGWASATRVWGTDYSLRQDRHRSEPGPGGNLYMVFYWLESVDDYPPLSVAPDSGLISRAWRQRWG